MKSWFKKKTKRNNVISIDTPYNLMWMSPVPEFVKLRYQTDLGALLLQDLVTKP